MRPIRFWLISARQTLADINVTEFDLHRASTDLGDRRGDAENNLWRVVTGARGTFEFAEREVSWGPCLDQGPFRKRIHLLLN